MAAIIRTHSLALGYGAGESQTTVLAGLDLTVERGEFVAVVGASGVGKSSLLRVLAGLAEPQAGELITNFSERPGRRPVSMVFQDPRLLPWRRINRNVEFGLEGLGLDQVELQRRAAATLDLVDLTPLARRWPYQLSGGQRQRVGLARALAVEPELLLLDEPFGALDAMTRQTLQGELLRLWRETGTAIVLVTHDLEEAVFMADRVVLLGGTPAGVKAMHVITEPRPRTRGVGEIIAALRADLFRVGAGEPEEDGAGI